VFGGAERRGSAPDEQACLDVLADAGLGEVGADDEQDAPVRDRQLGMRSRPAPAFSSASQVMG
jgi:hypothetical protein